MKLVNLFMAILEVFWIGGIIVGIKRILDGKILIGLLNIFLGTLFGIIDLIVWVLGGGKKLAFGTTFE